MKHEFFTARLLQIQLEMEAVKAEIAGMESEDADRTRQGYALAWGPAMFNETAATLRSLQGDIKALMEEYSKGEETPAAGKNERLYTLKEIEQSFIAGKKSANDDARGIKGQLCSEWVTTLDATRKFDLEGAGE